MLVHPVIDPVLVSIGPVSIRWYSLLYVSGFVLAWVVGRYRAKKEYSPIRPNQVEDLIFYSVIGVVAGARLGYVFFYDFARLLDNPLSLFMIWTGGMSFHGGVLGLLAATALFARRNKLSKGEVGDFLAVLAPMGLFLGRIGNFINGELWGKPTGGDWGVVFPAAGPEPRHPSQLYEAGLEGLALFVLVWMFARKKRPPWSVTGVFLLGYGLCRFIVEFVRMPDPQLGYLAFGWLTMGQVLCLPMIIIGVWLALRIFSSQGKKTA